MSVEVGASFRGRQKFVRIELSADEAEGLAELLDQNSHDRGFRELSERISRVLDVIREQVK